MKRIAIYPGSFDPVTNGHLDIVRRACKLFDLLIVSVSANSQKIPSFSLDERVRFLEKSIPKAPNIRVEQFSGLLANYVTKKKACAVIRGLRAVSDFEYEFQMALMNRKQWPNFETVFLMPDEKYTYLSSRMVREVARLGGEVSDFVPPVVVQALKKRVLKSSF